MVKTRFPVENMETGGGKKRIRQRKLNLYENIQKQMEFYFSTPNLQKDRFLKKLVMSDPEGYVDLETFLAFNKIKALTNDVTCIAKAIKKSTELKVDDAGKRVTRVVKFEEPQDTDERTVYTEFLPKDVTIDWLIRHFSQAGKVVHVSLPKYKSTGDVKGFAFVEFSKVAEAEMACRFLNHPPGKLSASRPGIFAKTFKAGRHMQRPTTQESMEAESTSETQIREENMESKEELADEDKGEGSLLASDKKPSEQEVDETSDVAERKSKKKRKRSESPETSMPAKEEKLENEKQSLEDACEVVPKKKKRKHGKQLEVDVDSDLEGRNHSEVPGLTEATEPPGKEKPENPRVFHFSEGLRVISKREWLEYRQDYYQKHKQNMFELKTKMRSVKQKEELEEEPKTTLIQSEHSNGYEPKKDVPEMDVQSSKDESLTFVPNVIIKVTLAEPVSKKFLKEYMSEVGKVAFLDMVEGNLVAHARCVDSNSAATILKASSEECHYELLQGEEEMTYWDKVFSDRDRRVNSKSKKKVRGKDRVSQSSEPLLLSKAYKVLESAKKKAIHVVFDD